jgi:hypothetical protein
MKAKISSLVLSLLFAYLICQLSGCSLNFPLGDSYTTDNSLAGTQSKLQKPGKIIITGDQFLNVKSGTTIEVILRSGRIIKGKYYGMTPIPKEDYSERYAAHKEKYKDIAGLPELGETVTLAIKDGSQYDGDFFGFDFGAIRFRKKESNMIGTWYLNTVDCIVHKERKKIELETLKLLMREGKIPFLSAIVLRINKEESRIELDDVSQIKIEAKPKKSYDKSAFVVISLIVFGALVYALLQGWKKAMAEVVKGWGQ